MTNSYPLAAEVSTGIGLDPTHVYLPDSGNRYQIIDRIPTGVTLALDRFPPAGLELRTLRLLIQKFPLARELFAVDDESNQVRLPSAEGLNVFGRAHLEPLGATTMITRQLEGGNLRAEDLTDGYADGFASVATEAYDFFHDIHAHGLGAKVLAERPTQVFRQIAGIRRTLHESDPEAARILAVTVAEAFDIQTFVPVKLTRERGARDIEEPLLLTEIQNQLLRHERASDAPAVLAAVQRVRSAIEATIAAPDGLEDAEMVGSKLDQWALWEAKYMPAFAETIRQKLAERPWQPRSWQAALALADLIPRPAH